MKEWHYNEYIDLRMNENLMSVAHKVNDEAYELINMMSKNIKYGMERIIVESDVIRNFVLKIR